MPPRKRTFRKATRLQNVSTEDENLVHETSTSLFPVQEEKEDMHEDSYISTTMIVEESSTTKENKENKSPSTQMDEEASKIDRASGLRALRIVVK